MSWPLKPLGQILELSGRNRAGDQNLPVLSITMKHGLVDQADKFKKRVASSDTSNYRVAYKNELVVGFPIDEGVLGFQTKYPAGIVSPAYDIWKLRNEADSHIPYLERYLRSAQARGSYASRMQGAVARRRSLTKTDFLNLEIPFPPLDDQIRIAHLLGKVEGLIAQRKQNLQQLDNLLKSLFLEMFGDPVRNEKGWPINQLATYLSEQPNNGLYKPQSSYGSGTRIIRIDSFHDGIVRNVEDLKRVEITDAELLKFEVRPFDILVNRVNSIEHLGKIGVVPEISEPMVYESNMMRFRLHHEAMLPVYLTHFWRTQYLKSQINSKAKKAVNQASVNQQDVIGLLVPQPPIGLQKLFSNIVEKVEGITSRYQQSLNDLEALHGALSQRAFKGELDLSRVALPATPIEGESPVAAAMPTPITTPVIELPETDLLLPALQDRTQLAPLLRFWLVAYRTQLGGAAFSLERFIAAAQIRLAELHPDHDFALDASDYEAIKAWVFDEIRNGKLKQTRDIICIDGRRQFGNQILLRARRLSQQ